MIGRGRSAVLGKRLAPFRFLHNRPFFSFYIPWIRHDHVWLSQQHRCQGRDNSAVQESNSYRCLFVSNFLTIQQRLDTSSSHALLLSVMVLRMFKCHGISIQCLSALGTLGQDDGHESNKSSTLINASEEIHVRKFLSTLVLPAYTLVWSIEVTKQPYSGPESWARLIPYGTSPELAP